MTPTTQNDYLMTPSNFNVLEMKAVTLTVEKVIEILRDTRNHDNTQFVYDNLSRALIQLEILKDNVYKTKMQKLN